MADEVGMNYWALLFAKRTKEPVFPNHPAAVTIIEPVEEEDSFTLNVEFLEKILLHPDIADKKVGEKYLGPSLLSGGPPGGKQLSGGKHLSGRGKIID